MTNLKQLEERIKIIVAPSLREKGFKGTGKHYRRINPDGTINCIVFQSNRYGEEFTVELGFHLDFLPTLMNQRINIKKVSTYDCEFRKRLSLTDTDKWWSYGETLNETDKILETVLSEINTVGEKYFEIMSNEISMLKHINIEDLYKLIKLYGGTTEIRMILFIARYFTKVEDYDLADKWIEIGLSHKRSNDHFNELFKEQKNMRFK